MSNLLRATPIVLTAEERAELEGMSRSTKSEHRARFKARIVLMAAEGAATRAIGRALGCTTGTASKWRVRYAKDRLRGFSEVGDRGAEARYDRETDRRILALLDAATPEGYANWTGPLIAKRLGDVHVQYVWRFLRAQKIDLSGRKSWCQSDDPEFAAKAAEIVGLDRLARQRDRACGRRKTVDSGARTRARLFEAAQWARHRRPVARLQTPRDDDPVCRP